MPTVLVARLYIDIYAKGRIYWWPEWTLLLFSYSFIVCFIYTYQIFSSVWLIRSSKDTLEFTSNTKVEEVYSKIQLLQDPEIQSLVYLSGRSSVFDDTKDVISITKYIRGKKSTNSFLPYHHLFEVLYPEESFQETLKQIAINNTVVITFIDSSYIVQLITFYHVSIKRHHIKNFIPIVDSYKTSQVLPWVWKVNILDIEGTVQYPLLGPESPFLLWQYSLLLWFFLLYP